MRQILNEEIYDLLADASNSGSGGAGLSVRGEGKRGIVVAGLSEHSVESLAQVAALLTAGALQRATASTTMNAQSSRSHAICTLTMEQYDAVAEGVEARFSKFHLVDLAGSERAKRTNAQGARFKEGVSINRGLLALGNVINALCERSRSSSSTSSSAVHVPYRDSKLTRLLQDSLGGNSKTLMIACVSPADIDFEETTNTLRYASRARSIQNNAIVNKEMSATNEVAYLKQQLEVLQLQLLQQQQQQTKTKKQQQPHPISARDDSSAANGELEAELVKWKRVAHSREEELRLVTSAKDKWKKVADGLLASEKKASAPSGTRGGVGSNATSTSSVKALALEAMEFERSLPAPVPAAAIAAASSSPSLAESTSAAPPSGHEMLQADLDSLLDVIAEKEKIVRELASLPPSSTAEVRLASLAASYEQKINQLEDRVEKLSLEKKRLFLEVRANGGDQFADGASNQSKESVLTKLLKVQSQLEVAKQAGKECARLTGLWKTGKFKISTLEQEIADMKKHQTGLQRKLKEEAETHRREMREQDLKMLQLKRQDQRKQLELQRLTTLHAQQNSALKRKTEEVATANKRMRAMAANQQQQKSRPSLSRAASMDEKQLGGSGSTCAKAASRTDFMDSIAAVLERTLEVQTTIQGAKRAIELDLEERRRIALKISTLEATPSSASSDALAELKESLREKSGEIRLLQQKLASVERTNVIPDELFPSSAASSHQVIRFLIEVAVESKSACMELESAKSDVLAVEEQLVLQRHAFEHTIAGLKSEMREINDRAGVPRDSATELLSTKDDAVAPAGILSAAAPSALLQRELEAAKTEVEALKAQLVMQEAAMQKKPAPKKRVVEIEDEIVSSSESDDDDDDRSDDDSDYVEHEYKKPKSRASGSTSAAKAAPRRPSGSGDAMDEIDDLLATPSRAGVPLCCSCATKCATKACACKAEKQKCGSSCACNASRCHNREGVESVRRRKDADHRRTAAAEVESFFQDDDKGDNDDQEAGTSMREEGKTMITTIVGTAEAINLT